MFSDSWWARLVRPFVSLDFGDSESVVCCGEIIVKGLGNVGRLKKHPSFEVQTWTPLPALWGILIQQWKYSFTTGKCKASYSVSLFAYLPLKARFPQSTLNWIFFFHLAASSPCLSVDPFISLREEKSWAETEQQYVRSSFSSILLQPATKADNMNNFAAKILIICLGFVLCVRLSSLHHGLLFHRAIFSQVGAPPVFIIYSASNKCKCLSQCSEKCSFHPWGLAV